MKRFAWALLCLIPSVAAAQNSPDGRRLIPRPIHWQAGAHRQGHPVIRRRQIPFVRLRSVWLRQGQLSHYCNGDRSPSRLRRAASSTAATSGR